MSGKEFVRRNLRGALRALRVARMYESVFRASGEGTHFELARMYLTQAVVRLEQAKKANR